MGLIVKKDKGDKRSRREIAEAVDEDIARRVFKRCTLFCGDEECRKGCMKDKK